ncbi:flagellar filament capping protein FliD [Chitinimonas sp. PSY-7]|uniref:flagellar filament capping protein FliD n=1 Tax=Chitinimonas sp. PSY-7 TaxID=3459088 RepID=UPI00403FE218
MAITSTGLGSGLKIEELVTQLVAAERDPAQKQLTAKATAATAKLTALGMVRGALSSFQSSVQALESASRFITPVTTSSDSTSVSATAAASTPLGSHAISVSQLAQNQRIKSEVFSSVDTVVGTGKLIIDFGTIADATTGNPTTPNGSGIYSNAKFTTNTKQSTATITIDSQHNTLSGIREAINSAHAGVTASIINDGSGFRLVLSSDATGESNSMRITVVDPDLSSTDTNGLSKLAYDVTRASASGQNLAEVQSGKSAKLKVDGVDITSESNTPSDILTGISLNLQKVTTSPVTITIGRDPTNTSKLMETFVNAYNELNKTISDVSYYDKATGKSGALQGETVVRSLQYALRGAMNGQLAGGTFTRMSDVGIGFTKDGTMTYDSSKFNAAVTKDAASVAALFGSYGVATDTQLSYVSSTGATKPGKYAVSVSQMAAQGFLTAGAAVPAATNINLTATTNTLTVTVDGATSGTITLNAANYATTADLAVELQAKINGDPTLKAAGAGVAVSFDAGTQKFTLTSNRYGSTSTVAISSISSDLNTALGFATSNTGTAGLDIVGSIGGNAATGSGQYLTGSGAAVGLKVLVSGGAAGARGTVSYNRGFAYQLDDVITAQTSANGVIAGRTNTLNSAIDGLNTQFTKLTSRMDELEKRYRAQFTQLDITISKLQSTGTFLTQQLSALNPRSS